MDDRDKKYEEFKKSLIKHFEKTLKVQAKPYLRGHVFHIPMPIVVDQWFVVGIIDSYNHIEGVEWSKRTDYEGSIKIYAIEKEDIISKVVAKYGSDFIEIYIL